MQIIVKGIPPSVTEEEIGEFLRGFNEELNHYQLFADDLITNINLVKITEPMTKVQTAYAIVDCTGDGECRKLINLINNSRFNGLRLQAAEYIHNYTDPFTALHAAERCKMEVIKL